jgi:hypothetical protein
MKTRRKVDKGKTTTRKVRAFVELFSRLGITFQDIIDEYNRICRIKEKCGGKNATEGILIY